MKSILLSIKPQYVAKILNGEKTVEIRKHAIPVGTKVYVYCTMKRKMGLPLSEWNGKVVASFVVSKCEKIKNVFGMPCLTTSKLLEEVCVSKINLHKYANGKDLFAWHISQLKIFDRPKELREFSKYNYCLNCCACKKATGKMPRKSFLDFCHLHKLTKAPRSFVYVEELK